MSSLDYLSCVLVSSCKLLISFSSNSFHEAFIPKLLLVYQLQDFLSDFILNIFLMQQFFRFFESNCSLRALICFNIIFDTKEYLFFLFKIAILFAVDELVILPKDFLPLKLEVLRISLLFSFYHLKRFSFFIIEVHFPLRQKFSGVLLLHLTELYQFFSVLFCQNFNLSEKLNLSDLLELPSRLLGCQVLLLALTFLVVLR
jgi:hypothetical protein